MELTQDVIAKFKRYEELKIQEREVKKALAELQPEIAPFVPEDTELQGERGYFYVQKRPTWKFSEAVEKAEENVDILKKEEMAKGIAQVEYKPVLYYKEGEKKEQEADI